MAEQLVAQEKQIIAPTPMFAMTSLAPGSEDYLHELRVRIPVDLHRQLLSLKILRGKSLAATVSTALDIYFAEHARRIAEASERADADKEN